MYDRGDIIYILQKKKLRVADSLVFVFGDREFIITLVHTHTQAASRQFDELSREQHKRGDGERIRAAGCTYIYTTPIDFRTF